MKTDVNQDNASLKLENNSDTHCTHKDLSQNIPMIYLYCGRRKAVLKCYIRDLVKILTIIMLKESYSRGLLRSSLCPAIVLHSQSAFHSY